MWALALLALVLVHGVGALAAVGKQQSTFQLVNGFGMVAGVPVTYTAFSQAPDEDVQASIGTYTELRIIFVSNPVRGARWELSPDIGLVSKLQVLYVPTLLRGTIPTQFGLLTDLRLVDMRSSALEGTLPSELGLLTNSAVLQLSETFLSGTIPTELGQLTSAITFRFANSRLEGPIPSQLASLGNVTGVFLSDNALEGTLSPVLLVGWPRLGLLDVTYNRLGGTLPSELGASTTLIVLWLAHNGFTGSLPSQLGRLDRLTSLDLQHNQLRGPIVSQLGALTSLFLLRLGENMLSGTIPVELERLTKLLVLALDNNRLSGTVPPALFTLEHLGEVDVAHNNLRGRIPASAAQSWRDNCDFSGLTNGNCQFDCPACGVGKFQVVECGPGGEAPSCVAWWALVAALVGCLAVCLVLARSVFPSDATARQLCVTAVTSSFAVVDLIVDYLFALNAHGVVQALSYVSWGGVLALSFFAALGLGYAHRLWLHPVRLVGACVLCTVSPACLTTLVNNAAGMGIPETAASTLERHKGAVSQVVLWLTLAESLSQGALQCASVAMGDTSTITILSLCFSTFHVVSVFTVSVVLVLAREPKDSRRSEADEPERRTGKRRRGVAAAILLCLVPALAFRPTSSSHEATPSSTGKLVPLTPPEARGTWEWSVVRASQQTTATTKSGFECASNSVFDARLPYICSLGELVILINSGLPGTDEIDLDVVAANAPTVFAFVALAEQPLGSVLGQLTSLLLLLLEKADTSLPSQVGLLSQLRLLRHSNSVRPSTIPSEVANARSLIDVAFEANTIVGTLPSQLALLTDLAYFSVMGNKLMPGTIPSQFGLLRKLWHFDVSTTAIGGSLPSELGNCPLVRQLRLGKTKIGGTTPSQLGQCSHLEVLSLEDCLVVGTIPTQLYSLTMLTELAVQADISGALSCEVGALTRLNTLKIESPAFGGTVPTQLGLLQALTVLGINNGKDASGTIPTQLGLLVGLRELSLQARALGGTVPSEIGLLTALARLFLADNTLEGTLPSQLALLTALAEVELSDNRLDGTLPAGLGTVWRDGCDYSGIQDCRKRCSPCAFGSLEVGTCDSWGRGQTCVPPYVTLLSLACFAGVQVGVVKKLGGRTRPKVFAHGAVVAVVSAAHLLFDWTFAMDADQGIRAVAVSVLCVSLLARLILVASELLRLQRQEQGTDIASSLFVVVVAVAVCVVDPFTLKRALRTKGRALAKLASARVARRVLVVMLLSDLPMLVLQSVRMGLLDTPSWVVTAALVFTLLSIANGSRYWPCVRAPTVHATHVSHEDSVVELGL